MEASEAASSSSSAGAAGGAGPVGPAGHGHAHHPHSHSQGHNHSHAAHDHSHAAHDHSHSHGGGGGGGEHGHSHNGAPCTGHHDHKPPSARFMFLSMGTMMSRQVTQHLSAKLATAEGRTQLSRELLALPQSERQALFEAAKQETVNMAKTAPANLPANRLPLMGTTSRAAVTKWLVKRMDDDFASVLDIPLVLLHLGGATHEDSIMAGLTPTGNDAAAQSLDIDADQCHPDVKRLLTFHSELSAIPAVEDENMQKVNFEVLRYLLGMVVAYAQDYEEWVDQDGSSLAEAASGGHGHSHNGKPCHGHGQQQPQQQPQHAHTHGGQPCHGHGHDEEGEEEDGGKDEEEHHGHSHSHGQGQHGHSHDAEQPQHGHSHGGQPCHGHGHSQAAVAIRHCGNDECGKEADKMCSRCKAVAYCSKECQTAHWKSHKKVCGK